MLKGDGRKSILRQTQMEVAHLFKKQQVMFRKKQKEVAHLFKKQLVHF